MMFRAGSQDFTPESSRGGDRAGDYLYRSLRRELAWIAGIAVSLFLLAINLPIASWLEELMKHPRDPIS